MNGCGNVFKNIYKLDYLRNRAGPLGIESMNLRFYEENLREKSQFMLPPEKPDPVTG